MGSLFKRSLTNKNQKIEFLSEKELAIADEIRVVESRYSKGFPKVPEERYSGIQLGEVHLAPPLLTLGEGVGG